MTPARLLEEFHGAFGQPFGHGDRSLRGVLHEEEHRELMDALGGDNLVEIAHELGDVVYVSYGTAHVFGLPLDLIVAEIHRANMSKFGPSKRPTLRTDGKVLKSDHYAPPDIDGLLKNWTAG